MAMIREPYKYQVIIIEGEDLHVREREPGCAKNEWVYHETESQEDADEMLLASQVMAEDGAIGGYVRRLGYPGKLGSWSAHPAPQASNQPKPGCC